MPRDGIIAVLWLILPALAAGLWLPAAGSAFPGPERGRPAVQAMQAVQALRPVDDSEEYYLGRTVAARILSAFPLSQDARLRLYVQEVGETVARHSSRPKTYGGYHFAVLDTPEINAFACPGGIVFISLGLFKICGSEDELAAALAHEVAHVARRDGVNAIKKSRWAEVLQAAGARVAKQRGGPAGQLAQLLEGSSDDVFQTLVNSGYSRTSEWAADQEALRTLARAGYNPAALASLLAKMMIPEKRERGLFRTHPPTGLRLARVKSQVGDAAPDPKEKMREKRFQEMGP